MYSRFIPYFIEKFLYIRDYPEDSIDSYFSQILPIIFSLISVIIIGSNYLFKPITCWVPNLWIAAYEEYANCICWSENTYFMNIDGTPPKTENELQRMKINYYQWVSLFLIAIAIMLLQPQYIWKLFCGSAGSNIIHIIRMTTNLQSFNKLKRNSALRYISQFIHNMTISREYKKVLPRQSKFLKHLKISGNPLIIFYLMLKLLYVIIGCMEVYIIQRFLNMHTPIFAFEMLHNFTKGLTWKETGKFPVITWCKIMIKTGPDVYYRNIQCTLPNNIIYEKVFIGISLILIVGIVLMILSIFYWIIQIYSKSRKYAFISKHLSSILDLREPVIKDDVKYFINYFLSINGLFMLNILSQHTDSITFQIVVEELWNSYKSFQQAKGTKLEIH